jgi:Ser/Thr protein kinase RdoA (MazF antagonist)
MTKGALLANGRTAEIYAWGDGQILKLYRDFVPDSWIEHEAWVSQVVMEAGLRAPRIGERVTVDGRQGLIYERIDGPSLLQTVATQPWTLFRSASQFGTLHAEMHNMHRPNLPAQRQQILRTVDNAPHLSPTLKERVRRRLATLPDGDAVCHGDYHPDNILLSAQGPVIIDWMTVSRGNPAADVARTTLLFLGGSLPPTMPRPRQIIVQGLRRLYYVLYLRAYRRRRSVSQIEIDVWLPILAAARLNERIAEEEDALIERVERAFGP